MFTFPLLMESNIRKLFVTISMVPCAKTPIEILADSTSCQVCSSGVTVFHEGFLVRNVRCLLCGVSSVFRAFWLLSSTSFPCSLGEKNHRDAPAKQSAAGFAWVGVPVMHRQATRQKYLLGTGDCVEVSGGRLLLPSRRGVPGFPLDLWQNKFYLFSCLNPLNHFGSAIGIAIVCCV